MENKDHIKGWGIDADAKNDPTYPIKKRLEKKDQTGKTPEQQSKFVEVLTSVERPSISAVFGDSVPPSGLSGRIRRFAFEYGEGAFLHWLPLIFADRVNEIEGIIEDIKKGAFPDILSERGMKASWKYNKNGVIKKAVLFTFVSFVAIKLLSRKN
ncbi:hypothetical protein [Cyclobacterium jeungdonense]|uniref:Uncharacterized protein n=1 Tax=Cyclobacterium jeungdonense TaxID=708087 RepID=A0ABT8CAC3_9BACT|nr:hypothetical protein [Cyclobacterium jeungdonense]MDN3688758.1 hypothetical protein [Cyclobacterium jeungdonense]